MLSLSSYLAIATAIDPILNVAIWVGIAIFILNIGLIAAILSQKYLNLRSQKQEKITKSRWMPIIIGSLAEIPPTLPIIKPQEGLLVLNLWLQVDRVIRGETRDRLHEFAYLAGMPQIARRFLQSRHLDAKLVGIIVLGSLKERSALAKLQKLVNQRNSHLSVAAAIALSKIDIQQSSKLVCNLVCDRLDWSLALVVELLSIEGNDLLIAQLLAKLPKLSAAKLNRVFRALEVSQKQQLLPVIPELLHQFSDREEIIAGCLRILSSYKNVRHLQIIREYIEHPSSSVRVQVANGLSQMGTIEDESILIKLLSDPIWWVRYRAAQALTGLPSMNVNRLEQIRLQQNDLFARDILTQVIEENKLTDS